MAVKTLKEKEDLRIVRTRKLLCSSLIDLMVEKDFAKINVNDICDRAMVHRATFYNHFNDKEDLLSYALDEIQEELFEATIEKDYGTNQKQMYLDLTRTIIDYFDLNHEKIKKILDNSSERVTSIVLDTLRRSVAYILGKNKYRENYVLPVDIVISFLTGGLAVLTIDWLKNYDKYTKGQILSYCEKILNYDIVIDKLTIN